MTCKYKKYKQTADGRACEKPCCEFTDGECQFVEDVSPCSIAAAFDGFEPETGSEKA